MAASSSRHPTSFVVGKRYCAVPPTHCITAMISTLLSAAHMSRIYSHQCQINPSGRLRPSEYSAQNLRPGLTHLHCDAIHTLRLVSFIAVAYLSAIEDKMANPDRYWCLWPPEPAFDFKF